MLVFKMPHWLRFHISLHLFPYKVTYFDSDRSRDGGNKGCHRHWLNCRPWGYQTIASDWFRSGNHLVGCWLGAGTNEIHWAWLDGLNKCWSWNIVLCASGSYFSLQVSDSRSHFRSGAHLTLRTKHYSLSRKYCVLQSNLSPLFSPAHTLRNAHQ